MHAGDRRQGSHIRRVGDVRLEVVDDPSEPWRRASVTGRPPCSLHRRGQELEGQGFNRDGDPESG